VVLVGILFAVISLAVPGAFSQSSSVYLRTLVVDESDTARQVADLLAQGKPFAQLASEYSTDPTTKRGGLLGLVALEGLQEPIRVMVESLEVGEFTGPVRVQEGLAFFQRTTMAHYTEALRLMQSETYPEALVSLDEDLVLNPDRVHSLELKAYALQQLRWIPEAETVYREIIRQEPNNVLAYNNLGALLDQEGNYADAVKLFERAIALDPAQNVTPYNLAWLYAFRLNNPAKALGYIQKAIALQPNSANYYALLEDIYTKQGKGEQASIAFAKAVELPPPNTAYKESLAEPGTAERSLKPKSTTIGPQAAPSPPTSPHQAPKPAPSSHAALSQPCAPVASIKVVAHPGGAHTSRQITRLLQHNGFPVALRITDPNPMHGIRLFHKPHAIETAQRIRNLISPSLQLRRLTWKSQFDIIVYAGQ
jgi:tetratricopeptide (TPR) repeat protein